ncbi:MAG: protein-L-isoaspartate(D-aspartate) O-methyltransferase [Planctomycetes bacterium]|nr:protein-L-isoaspartate(D-aspartate) O-methyltransferase [Planctomycetota bacterium]
MKSFERERARMVDRQIAARGVRNERVLNAMRTVPREEFVAGRMREFAYEDSPLPIEEGQTISQPYIVAVMAEALDLRPTDRVLEVGAGSGYAACVLSRIAAEVFAIERWEQLAQLAQERADRLGYDNVRVLCGDGTRGWAEHAPFDAIAVAAGGPEVPQSLLEQLAIGGRLVIPVGKDARTQELLHIRRTGEHAFDRKSLGAVRFVPLIGSEGWLADGTPAPTRRAAPQVAAARATRTDVSQVVRESCEPFDDLEFADLAPLLDRIGDSRVVLIGEASHGTREFYRMRARITQALIEQRGFDVVAIEGDWPDTETVDRYVRGRSGPDLRSMAYSRFPTWMWRNRTTREFVDWLKEHNDAIAEPAAKVSMHGLDLYSLDNSIGAVLAYLDEVDPVAARAAQVRYSCFSPWETDPAVYGRAAVSGRLPSCEAHVVATLKDLLQRRLDYIERIAKDGERFFDAEQNARVVRDAEHYYRTMYYGAADSWNLRDQHMFETLQMVLAHRGPESRAIVWAHNSHVGDARATEMSARGELNIGQLVRESYGDRCYVIGFGTDHGTVAAASNWNEPLEFKTVRPSHERSYERVCLDSGRPAFLLPLRTPHRDDLRDVLAEPRLERAIGVIYRPETELLSHYFQAVLPMQFDEYVWFEETNAIEPIEAHEVQGVPETYPFGV